MVALRGKKAKASATSRKTVEKAAKTSRQKAATNQLKSSGSAQEAAMGNEERAKRLIAYITQASLSIHANTKDLRVALPLSLVLNTNNVGQFLDTMLVAFCNSGKDKSATPKHILSRLTSASRKRVCGKIFSSDEIAYSCRNCQVDSSCVICKDCFMDGEHEGHDVYFQRTTAGSSCDCGDIHAWKRNGFCNRHPGAEDEMADVEGGGVDKETLSAQKKNSLPKAIRELAPVVIDAVVDFVYQVFVGISQSMEFAEALEVFTRDLYPRSLSDLTSSAIETNTTARPSETSAPPTAAVESRRRPRSSSASRRQEDVPAASTEETSRKPSYDVEELAIRLHNDDVHSLGEVVSALCLALNTTKISARLSVTEADRNGDTVVRKAKILDCAVPVGKLVRESLNVSVAPVWWQRQMELVPGIFEWLRAIGLASDGLYELISESLRKTRPCRLEAPTSVSQFIKKEVQAKQFWKNEGVVLNTSAQQLVTDLFGGDDIEVHEWAVRVEQALQRLYRFVDVPDGVAVAARDRSQDQNLLINEFLTAVALSSADSSEDDVRRACAAVSTRFLDTPRHTPQSLLGLMVRWDCALRKRTAHLGHALLREHMLNKEFRKHMLEEYARSYGAMTESYLKGLGNSTDSIFDFAVQFLTVPHLVKEYAKREVDKDPRKPHLAYELLAALQKVLSAAREKKDGQVVVNVDHPALSSQKYKHCIDDIEYVFNVGAMPNELVCDERNLDRWIQCLELLQNGDLHVRRGVNEGHVEYEPESWLSMFNLGIRIHSIYPASWNGMLPEFMARKEEGVRGIFSRIVSAAVASSREFNRNTRLTALWPIRMIRQTGIPEDDELIFAYNFDVASSATSLHVPLHRFLASSIRHVAIHVDWLQDVIQANGLLKTFALDTLDRRAGMELIELPLRSLVMSSQIHANMWRRNGDENMMAQLFNYAAPSYCIHYRDADVFLAQVSVLLLGTDTMVSLLVDRFRLGGFFIGNSEILRRRGYAKSTEEVDEQQTMQMVEELLRLIIVLGTSLPSKAGEAHEDEFLQDEMLQHLCVKSFSFSKLFEVAVLPTGQEDVSVPRLEQILTNVATFSPPSGLEPGRYELKEGLLESYDPYFLHLGREFHEMARDRWTSYRKAQRLKHQRVAAGTPPPAPLKRMRRPLQFLRPVRDVLACESTITLVHAILRKISASSGSSTSAEPISDAVISTTLHLLVYGVYAAGDAQEDGRSAVSDRFWAALAMQSERMGDTSVLSLLWELSQSKEDATVSVLDGEQKATLEWLLAEIKTSSASCAAELNRLGAARQADGNAVASTAVDAPTTLEQRKDEARKRALEAMARQQAAFQAMMANMEDDEDEDDEEMKTDEGTAVRRLEDEEMAPATALGKRRASVDVAEEGDETKRLRLASEAADSEERTLYKCILCHDSSAQSEMGVAAYVHQSTVLSGSFRPEPEEALNARGASVRKQVKTLVEKMDLCSGGPSVSSHSPSPSPALRALTAQFPDFYMDDGFDDELVLPPPNATGGQRVLRHGANADGRAPREGLNFLHGLMDMREDQRLFPMPIAGIAGNVFERRVGGAQRPPGADRGIVVARRNTPQQVIDVHTDSDSDDDDFFGEEDEEDDEDLDHHHHHHHHHHHNHHHHHHHHGSPRRPRSSSSAESSPLYLLPCGLHVRTCQHAVHIHCLERYIRSLHEKAIRGEDFDGVQAIDPDSAMTQFLCPLCKTLSNFLLPIADPASAPPSRAVLAIENGLAASELAQEQQQPVWYASVAKQLRVPGWYRAVLGRDGNFNDDSEGDAHDLWRDYFEETLWEPHGSLEKGAPFLWSACAFSLASFLTVAEADGAVFDALRDPCPAALDKEFASLVAVTKFCRWSFSLMEHSEDAKVIWETAKRCNPIHTETKREYTKFTKVLGSIDACLRGSILGLLVADVFTAFVVASVIADSLETIAEFMPAFAAADLLQRVHAEFFVQSKHDERSLVQDKFSLVVEDEDDEEKKTAAKADESEASESRPRRSTRRSVRAEEEEEAEEATRKQTKKKKEKVETRVATAKDTIQKMLDATTDKTSDEYALLQVLYRIAEAEPDDTLKPMTSQSKDLSARLARIAKFNGVLVRRMALFWRCLADGNAASTTVSMPRVQDLACCPADVFAQVWKWCVDRLNNKSFLGIAKTGDKCEHAEGCGEGYIASMFILRDQASPPRLIDLPVQYDVLYSMLSGRKCSRCDQTPAEPGICLVCGELLCCGDSCCTKPFVNHGPQVGECTRHAAECGGGVGVVLLLDQCRVAILGGSMAAHFPSPYVDAHGEEDVGLQRGRPLRLDAARYRHLETLWRQQRIFAEVSRQRNLRDPQYTINLSYL